MILETISWKSQRKRKDGVHFSVTDFASLETKKANIPLEDVCIYFAYVNSVCI